MKKIWILIIVFALLFSSICFAADPEPFVGTASGRDLNQISGANSGTIPSLRIYNWLIDPTGTGPMVFANNPLFQNQIRIGSDAITAAIATYLSSLSEDIQTSLDAKALKSVFGSSLNADDFFNNSGVFELQPKVPHTDATQTWSAHQTLADDYCWKFGSDSDSQDCWDSADAVREFRDSAGNPIFTFNMANGSFGAVATSSPANLFYDSNAPGSTIEDKFVGGDYRDYVDGAEDSENSKHIETVMIGGTNTEKYEFNGSSPGHNFKGYPAINMGAPTPTIDDPDNWTLTGYGKWTANAAGTASLPAIGIGMEMFAKVEGAYVTVIDPNGTEEIYNDGVSCGAGVSVQSDGAGGEAVILSYRASGDWDMFGYGWGCTP